MKWRIKGPAASTAFSKAAKIVISKRLKILTKSINEYFAMENAENLHEVRIAIRRLRYTLEVFFSCFEENIFTSFYNRIEYLQDLSGKVRDLDVFMETLIQEKVKKSAAFLDKLAVKRSELNEELRLEFMKFLHSREVKDFKNHLKLME